MLGGKRRYVIGVLSPVVGGYYFGRVLAGIARTVRPEGHRVVAVQTYPADLERAQFPDRPPGTAAVSLGRLDGVIVITSAVDEATLLRIEADGTPVVLVSERGAGIDAPVVTPDNEGGTRAAVEHLIAHGHREIGFLGSLRQADIVERHAAYLATLAAHGITPRPEWLYRTSDNQEASAAAVARALVTGAGPGLPTTATVAATDRNAIGFSRVLRAEGLSLPRDQAVVGFDHSEAGSRVRPRLATVDPHHDQVGELAVSLLLSRIRGERVAGQHLSRSTLVTRESCGCLDARAGTLLEGLPAQEASTAWRRFGEVARATFDGAEARPGTGADLESWMRGVQRVFRGAAALGQPPTQATLASLAESTRVLRPHPEALEQLIPALRAVEDEFREQVRNGQAAGTGAGTEPAPSARPGTANGTGGTATGASRAPSRAARARAVTRTATDVLVALSAGCTQTLLARSGQLERTITDQYELDLDLLHADGRAIRALTWLPRGHRSPATLALWTDAEGSVENAVDDAAAGARTLEIVGTTATSRQATALVGKRMPVGRFPPPALSGDGVVFVVPVTFGQSDWGMLAIAGGVDTRATSSRDKYDHWAAMVAVALDREDRLTSLQRQRAALAEAADRERALVLDLRTEVERSALVQDVALEGTWDWDIASGQVFYSRTWRALVGLPDDAPCTGIEEWTGRVHPDDVRTVQIAIARQLAGAADPLDLEHRLVAADGREMWVRCRATTVTDDAGVRARMIGVLMDVTGMPARERRGVAR